MLSLVGWCVHTSPLVLLWIHPSFWKHARLKKLGSQLALRVYSLVDRGEHCLREQKEIPVLGSHTMIGYSVVEIAQVHTLFVGFEFLFNEVLFNVGVARLMLSS